MRLIVLRLLSVLWMLLIHQNNVLAVLSIQHRLVTQLLGAVQVILDSKYTNFLPTLIQQHVHLQAVFWEQQQTVRHLMTLEVI